MAPNVNILLVVLDRDLYDKISPLLQRDSFDVNQAPNAESALLLTSNMAYSLVVLVHPLRGTSIEDFLKRLRRRESASADVPVLILAAPERIDSLTPLVVAGRVSLVSASQPKTDLQTEVSRLLGIRIRSAARLPITLPVRIGDGALERACQTENISESGILLRTSQLLPIGTELQIEIPTPGDDPPFSLRAEVIRHSAPQVEKVTGMGLKFIDLSEGDETRLRDYIAEGYPIEEEKA